MYKVQQIQSSSQNPSIVTPTRDNIKISLEMGLLPIAVPKHGSFIENYSFKILSFKL
jgi:hypothetical protein